MRGWITAYNKTRPEVDASPAGVSKGKPSAARRARKFRDSPFVRYCSASRSRLCKYRSEVLIA